MFNKFYYYLNDEKNLSSEFSFYRLSKSRNPKLKFVIMLDRDDLFMGEIKDRLKLVLSFLDRASVFPHDIIVGIDGSEHNFNPSQWEALKAVENFFKKKGITFGFEDQNRTWPVEEAKTANDFIIKVANEIKRFKLSPFEQLLAVHLTVTAREYKFEDDEQHFSESRSVYGVLNSDKIVCVGYSELEKAIIAEFDGEGLMAFTNGIAASRDNLTMSAGHQNLIIYINDEKYDISGFYYSEPTWDNGYKNGVPLVRMALIPLSDINEIRPYIRDKKSLKHQENSKVFKKKADMNDEIHRKKYEMELSFSCDGFKLTRDFIDLVLYLEPNLESKLEIEFYDEILNRAIAQSAETERDIENIKVLKQIFCEDKLSKISNEDAQTLNYLISRVDADSVIKVIKFKDSLVEKYKKNPPISGRDPRELFNAKLEYLELIKSEIFKNLDKTVIDDLRFLILKNCNPSNVVTQYLLENSPMIGIKKFELALNTILSKINPEKPKQEVYDFTKKILEQSVEYSRFKFTASASNAFVQQKNANEDQK